MKQQAARLAKANGFKSLQEAAHILGYHPSSLPRILKRDRQDFFELIILAKKLKGERDENNSKDMA